MKRSSFCELISRGDKVVRIEACSSPSGECGATRKACERMGTGSSEWRDFCRSTHRAAEPVPIFSQARRHATGPRARIARLHCILCIALSVPVADLPGPGTQYSVLVCYKGLFSR